MILTKIYKPTLILMSYLLLAACAQQSTPSSSGVTNIPTEISINRSPKDDRAYRYLTLDNGMQVVLVSDANSQQSVASLSVGVGSYQDPEDTPGLAHFLEHMLFLGTEKYPQPSSFFNFVEGRGGFTNAYTAKDHTNYYFAIKSDQLDGALDRFSDYFKAPTFNPKYVDKERTAVDNEWTKGRQQDGRIMQRVRGLTGNPKHPLARMSVGNLQTLKDHPSISLLDNAKRFYHQYYSANIMNLVLAGPQSLEQLEALAKAHFSSIKNRQVKRPQVSLSGYTDFAAAQKIYYRPQQNKRLLLLEFPLPNNHHNWQAKSNAYLNNLLTSEEPNTLGDYLRKQNLAVSSTAFFAPDYYGPDGFVRMQIQLTEQGIAQTDQIVAAVFSYLNLIRKEGINQAYYQELAAMADDQFANRDKGALISSVMHLSSAMFDYPIEHLLDSGRVYAGLERAEINKILNYMKPQNMRLWLVSPSVKASQPIPYYAGHYDSVTISAAQQAHWLALANQIDLALPAENDLFSNKTDLKITPQYLQPTALYQQNNIDAWLMHSSDFQDNQGRLELILNTSVGDEDARLKVLSRVFLNMFSEHLVALRDKAGRAGIRINILPYWGGSLRIQLQGKSDKHSVLLAQLLSDLENFQPSAALFEQTLLQYQDELKNSALKTPAEQAGVLLTQLSYQAYTYDQLLQASEFVALEMLAGFKQQLLTQSHKLLFAYGAYRRQDVLAVVEHLKALQGEQTQQIARYKNNLMPMDAGEILNFKQKVAHSDTAVLEAYIYPDADLKKMLLLQILNSRFNSEFFKQLRTEEQLGYQVSSMAFEYDDHPVFAMLVQSNNATEQDLVARYQRFIEDFATILEAMSDEEFTRLRESQLSYLLQKPNNLYQEAAPIVTDYIDNKLSFDTREKSIKLLNSVTRLDLLALYREMITGTQKMTLRIQLRGRGKSVTQK